MSQSIAACLDFIPSVLQLKPALAVFDCDGTLWSADAGSGFFFWGLDRGYFSDSIKNLAVKRHQDYKAGRIDEKTMCGEMVTIHNGISEETLREMASKFFVERIEKQIFPEMRKLTRRLAEDGCQLWAVSSTNSWVIAEGCKRFGIPRERVIAASVHITEGLATDRLIRVPTGDGKAIAIREVIGCEPDAVFGNSIHDLAMLEIAHHPFAINPNPDLEALARARNWAVYKPIPNFGQD